MAKVIKKAAAKPEPPKKPPVKRVKKTISEQAREEVFTPEVAAEQPEAKSLSGEIGDIKDDVKEYIDRRIAEVRSFVRSKSMIWLIALGVAVVLVGVLLFTVFKKDKPINQDYSWKVQALDSTIKYQQKHIDALQRFADQHDSVIKANNDFYRKNKIIETRIIHQYDKIPSDIKSMDRDKLRSELAD